MAEYEVQSIQERHYRLWDDFVAGSPQGCLYHKSCWKQIIDAGTPYTMRLYGCFHGGTLVGGCALTEKIQLGRHAGVNALTTPYAGFLLSPPSGTKISDQTSHEHAILSALVRFLEPRFHQITLYNSPGLADVRPLTQRGWSAVPCYTYVLDISEPRHVWEGMDGSVRQAIRKAMKQQFIIGISRDVEGFYNLLHKTFGRRRLPNLISRRLIEKVMESETLKDRRFLLTAQPRSGELASSILVLRDQTAAYYALAATDPAFYETGVHSLLIWELIQRLSPVVGALDFVGANIASIARFKEGFNPQLKTYYCVEKWRSLLLKWSKRLARRLRGY
jgi:hypothetical protein